MNEKGNLNSDLKKENFEVDAYYDKNDDKKRFPPFLLITMLTTIAVVGALSLSFSAIKYIESNETINTIISNIIGNDNKDKYIITYVENTGPYQNGINSVSQFPIEDSKGKLLKGENYVYNFSLIVGKKTKDAYYELTAVPDKFNTLNPSCVKIYLEKNGEGVNFSYKNNNKVKVYTDYLESTYQGTEGKVIYKGFVTSDDIKKGKIDFTMRMWISDDVTWNEEYNNRKFAVRVNTYASFLKGDLND